MGLVYWFNEADHSCVPELVAIGTVFRGECCGILGCCAGGITLQSHECGQHVLLICANICNDGCC